MNNTLYDDLNGIGNKKEVTFGKAKIFLNLKNAFYVNQFSTCLNVCWALAPTVYSNTNLFHF